MSITFFGVCVKKSMLKDRFMLRENPLMRIALLGLCDDCQIYVATNVATRSISLNRTVLDGFNHTYRKKIIDSYSTVILV
jgi:hypothetical protein